jgi:flagellar biosynthesis anti-sigma factor FlgM
MKGIISSHSALTAYQRQTAVDPVSVPQSPTPREGTAAGGSVRAARVSISAEARALAAGDSSIDQAKVERLRNALSAGSLKFDSQLVAQRMIDRAE